jgi:hypothetical protein
MLPDPIPYSESESLLLLQCFRFLVFFFLDHLLELVRFLAQLCEGLLYGIGFFPPFSAARKSDFPVRLSQNDSNRKYCASCMRPHASCRGCSVSWYELTFGLWDCGQYQVASYLSSRCAKLLHRKKRWTFWIFLWPHTRSIASRERRSERMSTGVPPFS